MRVFNSRPLQLMKALGKQNAVKTNVIAHAVNADFLSLVWIVVTHAKTTADRTIGRCFAVWN